MPLDTWLPITAFISGPPPLYGTWTRLTPALRSIITPKKCGRLPGAGLPKLAIGGFAFHQATSSCTVFAGCVAATDIANWKLATCAIGVKSTCGSYGSFENTIGASTVTTIGVSIKV